MPPDHDFHDVQVRGWEPSDGAEGMDVGITLGELPAGFGVASYTPRRLAPPAMGYAPSLLGGLHIDEPSFLPASAASSQSGSSPRALFESPPHTFLLPTPPQTRSSSLASGRARSASGGGGSSTRAAVSSRSPAAAGVLRKTRTSTERKFERKRAENANYIPRPKNSFILFRTEFVARHKRAGEAFGATASAAAAATTAAMLAAERRVQDEGYSFGGEGDELEGASLSKQASEVWNRMNEAEKQPWVDLAEKEKEEHARLYPNYRYRPVRSNSTTAMPSDLPAAAPAAQGRTRKSASPGARSSRSRSIPAEGGAVAGREKEKEEAQRRRCELIRELMAQGYRGGELTHALLMLEGGVLPPCAPLSPEPEEGGAHHPTPAPAPPVRPFPAASLRAHASIPASPLDMDACCTASASSSSISSSLDSITAQPPSLAEASMPRPPSANIRRAPTLIVPAASAPTTTTARMLSSSSSLACALTPLPRTHSPALALPRVPRSPSAPLFDTRAQAQAQAAANKEAAKRVSCPPTPTPHPQDGEYRLGGSSCSSPLSTPPTHSFPSSPDAERSTAAPQTQPAGPAAADSTRGYLASENSSQNDYVPMNEFYEHYECNASPRLSYPSAAQHEHEHQRPLEAVAAMWSHHAQPPSQPPEFMLFAEQQPAPWASAAAPRGSLSPLAALAAALPPACSHPPSTSTGTGMGPRLLPGDKEDVVRALAGLPTPPPPPPPPPPMGDVERLPLPSRRDAVLHPAPSLGSAACQRTDGDIEAYHLGLGNVLSSSSSASSSASSSSDCAFMFGDAPVSGGGGGADADADAANSCFEFFDLDFGSAPSFSTTAAGVPPLGLGLGLYDSAVTHPDEFSLENLFDLPMCGADQGQKDDLPAEFGMGFGMNGDFDDGYARFIQMS